MTFNNSSDDNTTTEPSEISKRIEAENNDNGGNDNDNKHNNNNITPCTYLCDNNDVININIDHDQLLLINNDIYTQQEY